MKQFTSRAYNNFNIDSLKSIIYKSSTTNRLLDESNYYKSIHDTPLSCFFPRIFLTDFAGDKHVLGLEYYGYNNLGAYEGPWDNVVVKLKEVLKLFGSYKTDVDPEKHIRHRQQMYIDKTLHYHHDLINNFPIFKSINNKTTINVNGRALRTFRGIWGDIEGLITRHLINDSPFSAVHGDLCFSNILYEPEKDIIKLIDPRGSFGQKGIYGDPLYDKAKLRHSFNGLYEYIIYDKFVINATDTDINYRFKDKNYVDTQNAFLNDAFFNDVSSKIIEGLIFIGMCSRHYDSLDRQLVMYATGLQILNEVLGE